MLRLLLLHVLARREELVGAVGDCCDCSLRTRYKATDVKFGLVGDCCGWFFCTPCALRFWD